MLASGHGFQSWEEPVSGECQWYKKRLSLVDIIHCSISHTICAHGRETDSSSSPTKESIKGFLLVCQDRTEYLKSQEHPCQILEIFTPIGVLLSMFSRLTLVPGLFLWSSHCIGSPYTPCHTVSLVNSSSSRSGEFLLG